MSAVDPDLAIKSHARSVKAVMDCVHERECAIALARADEAAGELGRWLDGEGARFATLAEYAELKTLHARYHQTLRETVTLAESGNSASALAKLKPGSGFAELSRELLLAFDALCERITPEGPDPRS